jgi:hypothetical protein
MLVGWIFLGWLGALAAAVMSRSGQQPVQHGTQVSFILPVCICEACDKDLTAPTAVRAVLITTPAYAALLDQYPKALIQRMV